MGCLDMAHRSPLDIKQQQNKQTNSRIVPLSQSQDVKQKTNQIKTMVDARSIFISSFSAVHHPLLLCPSSPLYIKTTLKVQSH